MPSITVEIIDVEQNFELHFNANNSSSESDANTVTSQNNILTSQCKVFEALHKSRHPVIIRGLDIGVCRQKWTPDYLISTTGDRQVKIHRSSTSKLDFRTKNFAYDTISFGELINHCSKNGLDSANLKEETYFYLRSIGSDPRGRDVSDIAVQFPELFPDIKIPKLFPSSEFFSSVFRITSPKLQLWTHYDTCDNILIQVRGTKRVVFFPPSEALNLYLDGDKSLVLDIDNPDLEQYPNFASVKRYEALLQEGDIVFIPSLWFHNVLAYNFSISVNVFWKNLDQEYYDKKDTYGNRDLIPAQLGFRTIEKGLNQLRILPMEYEDFYLRRVIISIQKRLEVLDPKNKE